MALLKMTAVVIALSLGLSACSGIQEWKAEQRAERALADRSECLAKGFKSGTDTFLLCLDNRSIQRQAEYAQSSADNAAREAKRQADWIRIYGTD